MEVCVWKANWNVNILEYKFVFLFWLGFLLFFGVFFVHYFQFLLFETSGKHYKKEVEVSCSQSIDEYKRQWSQFFPYRCIYLDLFLDHKYPLVYFLYFEYL